MAEFKVLSEAEAALRKLDVLATSASQRAGKAPVVENLLPALPGDNVAKLQKIRQGQDCQVIVEDFQIPPFPFPVLVVLQQDGMPVSNWLELSHPLPANFEMTLPGTATVAPGLFRLSYRVDLGGNQIQSDISEFFIDKTPPNNGMPGDAAVPPPEIVNGLVTREILDALGDITMVIPTPVDVKQGDICMGYYGKTVPGIFVSSHFVGEDTSAPIQIKIPKATIEASGDGLFVFYYAYEDRVGNVGPSSIYFLFNIQLTSTSSHR